MADCLFCKISSGEIPSDKLYEDSDIIAFRDIAPQAPVHILLVPRRHITSAAQLNQTDGALLAKIFAVASQLAADEGLSGGWRLVTNVGPDGGQSVPHLHFHLLGGRPLAWPPG